MHARRNIPEGFAIIQFFRRNNIYQNTYSGNGNECSDDDDGYRDFVITQIYSMLQFYFSSGGIEEAAALKCLEHYV